MRKVYYITIIIFFISCNNREQVELKENTFETAKKNENSHEKYTFKEEFFSGLVQEFSFNSQKGISIIGEQGTKINFPENCFGEEIEHVKVRLVEVYDINTMIKLNLTTRTTNNEILETGGMIFIEPRDSNGSTIHPQKKYNIDFSHNENPKMKLFKSEKENIIDISEWEEIPDSKIAPKKVVEKTGIEYFELLEEGGDTIFHEYKTTSFEEQHLFETLEIGWLNCDRFLLFENLITQEFDVAKFSDKNLTFFIVFKDYNSLVAKKLDADGELKFENLPKDEPVYCLATSIGNNRVIFGREEVSLSASNKVVFSNIDTISIEEFDKSLNKLFAPNIW